MKLIDTEKKFKAISKNSLDLIWIIDAKTMQYTFQSDAATKIHGYTPDEVVNGKFTISHFYSPNQIKFIENLIKEKTELIKQKKIDKFTATYETPLIRKDGKSIWVEISASATPDKDGNLIEFFGTTRVIDDRKKMELALKDTKDKYKLINDNTNDEVWIFDIETRKFEYISGAAIKISGFTAEEYLNKKQEEFLPPHSLQCINEIIKNAIEKISTGKKDTGQIFEIQQYHKDGYLIWIELSAKVFLSEDSKYKMVGTTRLIDDRKKMELALKESQARYSLITNTIRDIICIIDAQSLKYLYVTGACYELTGYTPKELTTLSIKDLLTAESFEYVSKLIQSNLKEHYDKGINISQTIFET